MTKYAALSATHIFIPLAFETLGSWGEQAKSFVAELGKRITAITGDVRETDFLRQRLSIAIQRGNAISIRGTLSLDPDCEPICS
jgi:Glu-tRNA(Gln) amidotransferase subunit E-like FAD-binding protein